VLYYFAVNLFVASKFLQGPLINDAAVQKVHSINNTLQIPFFMHNNNV
jgi:hypothetical protein